MSNSESKPTVRVTKVSKPKVSKQEGELLQSNALMPDDDFSQYYYDPKVNQTAQVLAPPYDPYVLDSLVQTNNSLAQCISAMEVNIDGTGFDIEPDDVSKDLTPEQETTIKGIKGFFNEPYPKLSMVSLRRLVRRDLEGTGNGYIEVLRTLDGSLAFINRVDAKTMRLLRLDDPVPVTVTTSRFGKEVSMTLNMRQRRFVQMVGKQLVYFKEYGASRDLNKKTGEWAPAGDKLPAEVRATEIIHLTVIKDVLTPYGVPRWVNQIPSLLGSRKAEELNLDFFNAGGLPPAVFFIQGGALDPEVRKQLQQYLSGKGASKNRAAIVEVMGSGGTIDSNSPVRVTVERFGSEKQQDSLFENYDTKCEQRVRSAFRLPPLFVGRTQDYTYATAFASYTVAEAQVFSPERQEFDEVMNVTIMKEISPGYWFRSLPLNVKDSTLQLQAITSAASAGAIDNDEMVANLNEVTNLEMKASKALPEKPKPEKEPPIPVEKAETVDPLELVKLASDWSASVAGDKAFTSDQVLAMKARVEKLDRVNYELFQSYVTMKLMGPAMDFDREGASELCGCAADIAARGK